MNLKDFLSSRDKPADLYWSLVMEAGYVQAGIWYIASDKAEVISVSSGAAWETEEELISAVDTVLSSAVQKLPENYQEPTKTVFGVPSFWVKEGEIKEEYLSLIKKVCTDLSLTPVGFVVLPEAIAHLYKSEEGAPVSAIVLGLGKENLELTVFKLGTLIGTTQVARSVSLVEDVVEGLSRFEGASPLPSRFVIYDGKGGELEEAKEILMQSSWDDNGKVKFLHTPKAEILVNDKKVLATSLAGANEIGDVKKISSAEVDNLDDPEIQNVSVPEKEVTPEELGFSIGTDITTSNTSPEPIKVNQVPQPTAPAFVQEKKEEALHGYVQKTKNLFHSFSSKVFFKKPTIGPTVKKPIAFVVSLLFVFLIGLGLFWWFYPKADVTIYASPKKFEQEVDVSFSTNGESDIGRGIIPATSIKSTVSGEKTKSTTGTKVIGDKAKGSVQIQNGTAFPINVTAGSFLISSGNLKFSLDNSASVSAALSPTSPGTASVSVTADSIGAQYNLAKDEVFKVGNYPKAEVDGTSSSDFTGGSSQEISAVDKSDATSLDSQLTDELSSQAKSEISGKVDENQIFVDDLATVTKSTETFDHKVGDEATNLKLSMTLDAVGIAADRAKLLEFAKTILKEKIPSGFVLRDSQIEFKFTFVDDNNGTLNYKVTIAANFLPEVNVDNLIKQISGKTKDVTETYLSSIPGFTRAKVVLKPSLGIFATLPHVNKNISVSIVPED